MEDALLDALVEGRGGGLVLLLRGLEVASLDGLAHGAEGAADAALVGAVYRGLGLGLTGAFERGDMIRHGV